MVMPAHELPVPRPIVPTVDSPPLMRMPVLTVCTSESPLRWNEISSAVITPPVTFTQPLRALEGIIFLNAAVPPLTITPVPVPDVRVTLPGVLKLPPEMRSCCDVAMATEVGVNVPPAPTSTMPLVRVSAPVNWGFGWVSFRVPTPVFVQPVAQMRLVSSVVG